MSKVRTVGWFEQETQILDATKAARKAKLRVVDVYTPYAVHGLDEAMGLSPSMLTWVCFLAGLAGGGSMFALMIYTSAMAWPLNVGGKPFASVPAFIPVTFEAAVLCAALTTVLAFFVRSKLFPGKKVVPLERVTDDRFALELLAEPGEARSFFERQGAVAVQEVP
ncbi:MAG: DUF3341 domain-containing protein [Proteobacteria bacterium]|nr:DUF3341 domain-containing protein [Cystobacterineae bacterium]MCL2258292.1 DUF3341 domain-containing protein [Cystobacterineae bacterium]MCL2315066.1 DUF3341 domain-containing protein [Pseudomonadota bacterium]